MILDARAALEACAAVLHQASGADLGPMLAEVDALAAAAAGVRAELALEAVRRGEHTERGWTPREWVFEHCPSLRQGGFAQLAKIVWETAGSTTIPAGVDYNDQSVAFDRDAPLAIAWEQVRTGVTTPTIALGALREVDRLADRVYAHAIPDITRGFLEVGVAWGPATMRRLRTEMIARWGLPDRDEVEKDQARLRRAAYLTSPEAESGDLTTYRLGLTPEQAAQLEAAIGPLAAPQPNEETGERDLRSPGQRRAEALITLATRHAATDADQHGGPATSDTCVQVTVALEDLRQHKGAARVLHSRADGTLLGIETLRKLCCDADLIPTVLGTDSQVVDVGMTKRLFTRAQRRILWQRDHGCTYPGCDAPPAWTKAHHVKHWADGGPTDLNNAALLCQRHHTFVHERRLIAEVRQRPDDTGRYVIWDLAPGSYDRALRGAPPWSDDWSTPAA